MPAFIPEERDVCAPESWVKEKRLHVAAVIPTRVVQRG